MNNSMECPPKVNVKYSWNRIVYNPFCYNSEFLPMMEKLFRFSFYLSFFVVIFVVSGPVLLEVITFQYAGDLICKECEANLTAANPEFPTTSGCWAVQFSLLQHISSDLIFGCDESISAG